MSQSPTTATTSTSMMTTRGTKRSRSNDETRAETKVSPRNHAKAQTYDPRPEEVLNPSLMTERQQLAFLLRKTAPAKSPAHKDTTHEDTSLKRKPSPAPSPVHKSPIESTTTRKGRAAAAKKVPPVEILCCVCSKYTCTTALFICEHCDKKYPTQKKLGLISV
ncbi:hypothetical protein ACHHYP_08067 [Achlya hypogyna]|uniref:Uncharacterized protein n=1 Tax=Achlya hypogyna TaxID=1202772 RepID=A0A1V9YPZ3_ACHHY|nr:hypothetical protein ACHHYP_08067 [Achlya hypogyna]